jgi:hypothetical protein
MEQRKQAGTWTFIPVMVLKSTSTTFADDTTVVATDNDPAIALCKLQTNLLAIKKLAYKMENESQWI